MLTHIKEDLLRRLQAIDPEQYGTAEAFLELCSVCALMTQELSPGLPQTKATLMDEAVLDATFKLASAAEKISDVLNATASMGKTAMDERADWDGFLNDAEQLRCQNRDLRDQIRQLFREGASLPEQELIDQEQQEVRLQREAYSSLRQTISRCEGIPYTESGNSTPPADRGFHWLKEWRKEVLNTLDHWRDLLNEQESVLTELNRWRSIVDAARKHLDKLGMTEEENSLDVRIDTKSRGDSVCMQTTDPRAFDDDDQNDKIRCQKLKTCFDRIKTEWQKSKWVEVLKLYDEILAIDTDNERAMRERPLALCCLIETLVLKHQSGVNQLLFNARDNKEAWSGSNEDDHARLNEQSKFCNTGQMEDRKSGKSEFDNYFNTLCLKLTPDRATEVIPSSDLSALLKKPSLPWNDESLKDTVWQPFFNGITTLEEDEKRYVKEFMQVFGDVFRSF